MTKSKPRRMIREFLDSIPPGSEFSVMDASAIISRKYRSCPQSREISSMLKSESGVESIAQSGRWRRI